MGPAMEGGKARPEKGQSQLEHCSTESCRTYHDGYQLPVKEIVVDGAVPLSSPLGEIWMSRLNDDTPLSAITIPGTHDSASYTSSWPFVATQGMDTCQQLNAGIRYFDLRCGVRDQIVEMVHGPIYLGLTLERVLNAMYTWLDAHRSEALIVQIKKDRETEGADVPFSQAVLHVLERDLPRWRTADTTPVLRDLRGRIQLFRRFTAPKPHACGIDVTPWEDNPTRPFTIHSAASGPITIQDHYNISPPQALPSLVHEKGGDVSELLGRAARDPDVWHWYLNFSSAYEFNFYFQIPPRSIAAGAYWAFRWVVGINGRLEASLKVGRGKRRRLGIVIMDFPELGADDLVVALIRTNFEEKRPVDFVKMAFVGFLIVSMLFNFLVCTRDWFDPSSLTYA